MAMLGLNDRILVEVQLKNGNIQKNTAQLPAVSSTFHSNLPYYNSGHEVCLLSSTILFQFRSMQHLHMKIRVQIG